MTSQLLKLISVLALLAALILIIFVSLPHVDTAQIWYYFQASNLFFIIPAFGATALNLLISTLRFGLLKRIFGSRDGWGFIHRVNIISSFYALLTMPLVMQITGRVFHGSDTSRKFYSSITVIEKIFSVLLMFSLAAVFSVIYLNESVIEPAFLISASVLSGVILTCFITAAAAFLTVDQIAAVKDFCRQLLQMNIPTTFGLTILMQIMILTAHVLLAYQFLAEPDILTLFGAFSLVVLATAVPIGFGGIGVREATAGLVFAAFGLPVEVGITAAALYNILYLTALTFHFFIARKFSNVQTSRPRKTVKFSPEALWQVASLTTVGLLCFQIRVPLATGIITINPVDFIAILIAGSILAISAFNGEINRFWQSRFMWPGLISFGVLIAFGWLVGWMKFGSNEWATANRLLGLVSISSYLISGLAFRRHLSVEWLPKLSFFACGCFIFSSFILFPLALFVPQNITLYFNWTDSLSGFVGDRNAYSFLGLILMSLLIYSQASTCLSSSESRIGDMLAGMLMALVFVSGSRSGWGGIIVVMAYLFWFRSRSVPSVLASLLISLIVVLGCIEFFKFISTISASGRINLIFMSGRSFEEAATLSPLRYKTWAEAYRLFIENPFFGAGLGAVINNIDIAAHNLVLWIMGEMGLFGLCLCIPLATALIRLLFYPPADQSKINRHTLFIILIVIGGFSLVQDIIYQRSLWLMLGFLCAAPVVRQNAQ